jgi:hypothetical protein
MDCYRRQKTVTQLPLGVGSKAVSRKFNGIIKIPASMKEILRRQNLAAVSYQVSYVLLLHVYTGNSQRILMNGWETIRKQISSHKRSEMLDFQHI